MEVKYLPWRKAPYGFMARTIFTTISCSYKPTQPTPHRPNKSFKQMAMKYYKHSGVKMISMRKNNKITAK
jgi:hypothetical protein